ncbi:unnamed protein product [Allacma fusca]|uniref:DNA 3'-5' helicase n=1 Tax=Allacma fusca TaxID=39272 RepID=A0A8J2IZH4_9HEXA|nr:unnamed protein product [Allacma fusca]
MDFDLERSYKKIEISYNGYKKVVLQWESAFIKTEGRKPEKMDLRQAPKNIKHSYDKYCKYKKVLATLSEQMRKDGRYKKVKEDNSTTPQKIFRSITSVKPYDPVPLAEKASKRGRSTPQSKVTFTKNLSKKLFLMQPSSSQGKKKVSESQSQNVFLSEEGSGKDSFRETLDMSAAESVSQCPDWSFTSNQTNLDESSSFELESINLGNSSFGCEDDVQVSDKLYSNFLEQYAPPIGSSDSSLRGTPTLGVEISKSKPPSLNDYNISSNDGSSLTSNSELNTIAEEVRQCFDILNSTGPEDTSDELYFPFSSFVNKAAIPMDDGKKKEQFTCSNIPTNLLSTSDQPEELPTSSKAVTEDRHNKENKQIKTTSPAKRKFSFAFSPSPEKQQKKKFFKTDRKTTQRNISLNSCRPEIPDPPPTRKSTRLCTQTSPVGQNMQETLDSCSNTSTAFELEDDEIKQSNPKKKGAVRRRIQIPNSCKSGSESSSDTPRNTVPDTIAVVDAFDSLTRADDSHKQSRKSKRMPRKQAKPKKTKGINDNYVSIDVTKKVFVRRKKGMTGQKMKRLDWKKKKSLAGRETKLKSLTCTKCGDIGHYARFCIKGKVIIDDQPVEEVDDSPWPTLEEATRMVWSKSARESQETRTVIYSQKDADVSDNAVSDTSEAQTTDAISSTFSSVYSLVNPNAKTTDPYFNEDSGIEVEGNLEDEVEKSLKLFGYKDFRAGQKEAIVRVLKGESTLLMLSTGSGKSLCYQLPAHLYSKKYPGTLTICVSPLVSLMEDQVEGMPAFLKAACLHYNMTDKKKDVVIQSVKAHKVQILLVSPEALCGGLFGLFRNIEELPPIGFACIDEVHCVSEWSHNFRPSYLQVCKILREKLNIKTLLGLTATATTQTCIGICDHLQVDPASIIRGEIIPNNLNLSVSRDTERDVALVRLLNGERFRNCDSIIIYCTRRDECNRIAEVVRTHVKVNPKFEAITKRGKSRVSNNCEPYHAGLTAGRRSTIQKQFMQGSIRIVVATIAFGMGINKSDIRSVIHYNLPSTFESYVQEIGRSGRDGLEANCHLFLDNVKGRDICELKRHIFANSVDRVTVRKLIKLIFRACKCKRVEKINSQGIESSSPGTSTRCPGHEVSFSVSKTVEELDLPEENIETLLCHLEVDKQRKWIDMLPKTYEICKIHSYGGSKLLKAMALKSPPLAVAIALEKEKKAFKDDDVYLEFNIIEAAANVGWNSAVVRRELKSLEWIGSEFNSQGKPTKFRKSGLMVEFNELAFRCNAPGNLNDKEYDLVFNSLCEFTAGQERRQLYQLQNVYQSMNSVSTPTIEDACDDFVVQSSDALKSYINEYFHRDNSGVPPGWKPSQQGLEKVDDIRREVRNLILNYKDTKFTGRSVAKIFQGLSLISSISLAFTFVRYRKQRELNGHQRVASTASNFAISYLTLALRSCLDLSVWKMLAGQIYLDYNATTPVAPEVISAITASLRDNWGNPSSTYSHGTKAKKAVEESRKQISRLINAEPEDIIFTSGGTEANKMAIESVVNSSDRRGKALPHVITSRIEHCSVFKVLLDLASRQHIDLSIAPINQKSGAVDADTVLGFIRGETKLITIMHANNETGVIMPVAEIGKKLEIINANRGRQNLPQIFFHTDAAQTIGKISVDVKELHVDYLTIVGHKFYGPRIGALYARGAGKVTPITPAFLGGGQERNFRSGTENTCMIEGLGVAADLVCANFVSFTEHMLEVKKKLQLDLQKNIPGIQINFENSSSLPNTLSVAVPVGLTGAKVLERCGDKICASLGAACHSSQQELDSSTVLTFSGLTSEQAKRTIRLSVGRDTSLDDIESAVRCIASACTDLN